MNLRSKLLTSLVWANLLLSIAQAADNGNESLDPRLEHFTTAGFYTTGSMTVTQGKYTSLEKVRGDSNGVTEVRATGELRPVGTLVTNSEYLKQGKWVPGHGAAYKEDPKAQVKFK